VAGFWTWILVQGYDGGPAVGPGGRGFHRPPYRADEQELEECTNISTVCRRYQQTGLPSWIVPTASKNRNGTHAMLAASTGQRGKPRSTWASEIAHIGIVY
jgi:hypothetical protein